jgi:hypothetical protein
MSFRFGETTKGIARGPLGVMALFVVLFYGFASIVVVFSEELQSIERIPVIWFLVLFPVVVLTAFAWLVSRHHAKLYAPLDGWPDAASQQASVTRMEAAASPAIPRREGAAPEQAVSEASIEEGLVVSTPSPSLERR